MDENIVRSSPLFAALDSLLLNHPTLNRAVQNIGGIANFSILPKVSEDSVIPDEWKAANSM